MSSTEMNGMNAARTSGIRRYRKWSNSDKGKLVAWVVQNQVEFLNERVSTASMLRRCLQEVDFDEPFNYDAIKHCWSKIMDDYKVEKAKKARQTGHGVTEDEAAQGIQTINGIL